MSLDPPRWIDKPRRMLFAFGFVQFLAVVVLEVFSDRFAGNERDIVVGFVAAPADALLAPHHWGWAFDLTVLYQNLVALIATFAGLVLLCLALLPGFPTAKPRVRAAVTVFLGFWTVGSGLSIVSWIGFMLFSDWSHPWVRWLFLVGFSFSFLASLAAFWSLRRARPHATGPAKIEDPFPAP